MTIIEKFWSWKRVTEEDIETVVAKLRDLGYKIEYDNFTKIYSIIGTGVLIYEG